MLDAKRALTEADGDPEEAVKWLRERGLGKAAERAGRESQEGAVAVSYDPARMPLPWSSSARRPTSGPRALTL